ncbi:glycosyltransferase family A protein [Oleispirillum naphthae]|uniref:glycosyltransferase family 2 protein n=1 Tax=Oleispirillum naphthae TaxID=2838853 RepID=UPI0030826019
MQTPPRISVVIPAYNCADTLARAVDSAVAGADYARTAMNLPLHTEIVVVNGASTDDTAAAIAALDARLAAAPHITFKSTFFSPNRGPGPSRNEGVRLASAPFIAFLDADDEYLPPHLGLCLSALLADRSIGYVWTRRRLDVPVHPSWGPSLDRSTVMNLCVRRIWHEIAKGFPEHADFLKISCEDSFYRIVLAALAEGRAIDEETVLVHFQPGNSLDRQKEKFATPLHDWDGDREIAQPTPAIMSLLEDRLAYVERLKSELRGN